MQELWRQLSTRLHRRFIAQVEVCVCWGEEESASCQRRGIGRDRDRQRHAQTHTYTRAHVRFHASWLSRRSWLSRAALLWRTKTSPTPTTCWKKVIFFLIFFCFAAVVGGVESCLRQAVRLTAWLPWCWRCHRENGVERIACADECKAKLQQLLQTAGVCVCFARVRSCLCVCA